MNNQSIYIFHICGFALKEKLHQSGSLNSTEH